MGRTGRIIGSGVLTVSLVFAAACGNGDADSEGIVVSTATTETITPAGAPVAERVAVIRLCKQVITSAGVMVRDYNSFIQRLNKVQDYKRIGDEDEWAIETLNTGADMVREAVAPDVPTAVDDQVQAFVSSSERLAEQIEGRRRDALNRVSKEWDEDRTRLLDTCSGYLASAQN